jgi:hypothetical protein
MQHRGHYRGYLAFEADGCSGGATQDCHTVQVEGWDNRGRTTYGPYGPICYNRVAPTIGFAGGADYLTSTSAALTQTVNAAAAVRPVAQPSHRH